MTRYKEQQKMKKCPLIYNSVIFPIPPLTFLPLFRTYDNMIHRPSAIVPHLTTCRFSIFSFPAFSSDLILRITVSTRRPVISANC